MQDDPLLFDYNVEERVNDFVAAAIAQVNLQNIVATVYRAVNYASFKLKLGCDFS